jgi:hypothetical protein
MTESEQLLEIKRILGLPTQLAKLLLLLLEKNRVRKDDLSDLISTYYGTRQYHNADRMVVYRLRSRLLKQGYVVHSQYGEGYYMDPSDKALIRGRLFRKEDGA